VIHTQGKKNGYTGFFFIANINKKNLYKMEMKNRKRKRGCREQTYKD
jgi:hypothetical protein